MSMRRLAIVVTLLAVAVLAGLFILLRWEQANKLATVMSALAGVTAVGVAVWAALTGTGTREGARVNISGTGRAVAGPRGRAVTGLSSPTEALPGDTKVHRTGEADASSGGDAVSGIDLT